MNSFENTILMKILLLDNRNTMSTLLRKSGTHTGVLAIFNATTANSLNYKDGGKDVFTYTGSGSTSYLSDVEVRVGVSGRNAGTSAQLNSGIERVASASTGQLSIATASQAGRTGVYLVRA
jgi:hypothetical protein